MAIQNDNTVLRKGDLKAYHQEILPYLGGNIMISTGANDYYSTDEKIVGVWIDGKPIYQKTINFGTLPNKTYKSVAHNISNFGECTSITAVAYNNEGFWRSLNMTQDNLSDLVITTQVTTTAVLVLSRVYDTTSYSKCYITIQYTKTTDTANSAPTVAGCYDINRPDLWVENTEIYFGNGLYGYRFTGNMVAISTNSYSVIQLKPDSTFTDSFKMVNSGGSLTILNSLDKIVNINLNASHNTSSSVLRASSSIFKTGSGELNLGVYMGDWHTTTSSTYDLWITYTK